MGCGCNLFFTHQKLRGFTISLLIILVLTQIARGRAIAKSSGFWQRVEEEDKVTLRARIGSTPPRCETRCSSCGHCEAIQVPTNPQPSAGNRYRSSAATFTIAYAGGDYSNYKPMSWKCKCGDFIFNP